MELISIGNKLLINQKIIGASNRTRTDNPLITIQ